MNKVHTHYDNLRVAQNAPAEVIQAAYRALCLKFHPDRNPDNPEAARIMAVINAAYEVLSDPAKRAEHDAWIAQREAALGQGSPSSGPSSSGYSAQGSASGPSGYQSPGQHAESQSAQQNPGAPSGRAASAKSTGLGAHLARRWLFYVIGALLVWKIWWTNTPQKEPPQPTTQTAPQRSAQPGAKRPAPKSVAVPEAPAAPEPAPTIGQLQTAGTDNCRVIVDNRQGHVALVGRLVRKDGDQAGVVRDFAVPASGTVNVRNVPPGTYEVRYKNPSTGEGKRTETFTLHETRTAEGVRSDVLTLTTYNVSNGNLHTTPIGEGEF